MILLELLYFFNYFLMFSAEKLWEAVKRMPVATVANIVKPAAPDTSVTVTMPGQAKFTVVENPALNEHDEVLVVDLGAPRALLQPLSSLLLQLRRKIGLESVVGTMMQALFGSMEVHQTSSCIVWCLCVCVCERE